MFLKIKNTLHYFVFASRLRLARLRTGGVGRRPAISFPLLKRYDFRITRFNPSKCQKKLGQCAGYPGIDRA
jgi:hypothetical protein